MDSEIGENNTLTNKDKPNEFDMPNDEDKDFVQSNISVLEKRSFVQN